MPVLLRRIRRMFVCNREVMMVDVFSWKTLTSQPDSTELLDGLSVGSLIVFAIMFLAIAALALWPKRWRLRRRIGRVPYGQWLSVGAWIASLGLLCLIVRFAEMDAFTLARPIWLVVALVASLLWLGWLLVMLRREPASAEVGHSATRRPRKGGSYR